MKNRSTQTQDKYVLRLPDGLRARIKRAAERSGRSMNAEILKVLEREYPEWTIEKQVDYIQRATSVLKEQGDKNHSVGILIKTIQIALATVENAEGVDEELREQIKKALAAKKLANPLF